MSQEPLAKSASAMADDHALPLAAEASSWTVSMHPAAAAFYFGLSCALAQGRVAGGCYLGGARRRGCRWSRSRELELREKVGALELQVEELRRRRAEDARANEKVAGIFASHEQRWLAERKALRRQVHAVVSAARAREAKRGEEAEELRRELEELRRELEEQRRSAGLKDEALEQEVARREGAEERLQAAEQAAEELRERARKDAGEHDAELRKHKAAFVELASAQRQLEADLARAARLADTAEAELRAALERRDEAAAAAADLSAEAARLRRDAEHKDKILSAMLRKSKIDMEDREMLVRDVKMCKARRKQAELEAERLRKMWESRGHRRGSSRSSARCVDHPAGCSVKLAPDAAVVRTNDTKILFVDHVEGDGKKAPPAKELTAIECVDRYPSHVDDKPAVEEYQGLQEWLQMETEKYTGMIKHRHNAEVEAFTEQLRLKDEKLEVFRWRAVSMDVEATRLRCRIQEQEARLAQHEQHHAGLEPLLLDRENQNRSLKEQLEALQAQALAVAICGAAGDQDDDTCDHCIPCSPVKIERTMSGEADRRSSGARHPGGTNVTSSHRAETKLDEPVSPDDHKDKAFDHVEAAEAHDVPVPDHACAVAATSMGQERHDAPARHSYTSEIEEEKEVYTDPGNAHTQTSTSSSQEVTSELALVVVAPPDLKASAWKTDIHALAVSYKIKRLKQQLLVLQKVAAESEEVAASTKPSGSEASGSRQHPRTRYQTMMSFLSKHVKRYQSLDDKIDDLCARMEESKRSVGRERRAAEQSAALGQFLEETFQLQRLMVATGQKLLETQSRIAPGLARGGGGGGYDDGVDMKRLMDVAGALLRDVQRGLELRVARIIGDLEGTLTFHGILHTTR
ncbi:uncharacterized protein LOC133904241 [Phragmites australis]|uniref:uncharacterized protein LOC133904241 n=1 Tax=Phragmites australis TaxID=29695 RepID=UPI002D78E465|nr:uncharacterized protein LOC133904241 [Phragmites australis]